MAKYKLVNGEQDLRWNRYGTKGQGKAHSAKVMSGTKLRNGVGRTAKKGRQWILEALELIPEIGNSTLYDTEQARGPQEK